MALYGKIKAKLGGKPFCTMVVLAAGSSKRMGRDKLMMEVGGVPVLVRSLQAMQNCAAVDELIVVTRTSRLEEIAALRDRYALTKMTKVVVGGAVLTPDYARDIGADYYCKDAKASADLAKQLLG